MARRPFNVESVALGPNGSYHVLFPHGFQTWHGLPKALFNQLYSRPSRLSGPKFVALGPSYEWFVCYKDGSSRWGNTTEAFDNFMENNNDMPEHVAFGPGHTWFIRFSNGSRSHYNYLPDELRRRLPGHEGNKQFVKRMAMGGSGDWWVRFTDGSSRWSLRNTSVSSDLKEADEECTVALGEGSEYAVIENGLLVWSVSDDFDKGVGYSLDPTGIRFTQTTIAPNFSDGRSIHDLAELLEEGDVTAEEVDAIRVVDRGEQGYWSLDNRRLWAFKEAGLTTVPVTFVSKPSNFNRKRKRVGDGLSVRVRGSSY